MIRLGPSFDRKIKPRSPLAWISVLTVVCPFVCTLGLASACGLGDECHIGDRRCTADGTIEECTAHPAGTDVSVDGPTASHHGRSPNSWDSEGACGAGLCQTEPAKDSNGESVTNAFCTLSPKPVAICANDAGIVCDGETFVECHGGFDIVRQICGVCSTTNVINGCSGGVGDNCNVQKDCATGLTCGPTKHCDLACACPDGARCTTCDAADQETVGPTRGASFVYVCNAGTCARKAQ